MTCESGTRSDPSGDKGCSTDFYQDAVSNHTFSTVHTFYKSQHFWIYGDYLVVPTDPALQDRFSLDQAHGLIVTSKNCTVTVFNVHAPTSATFSDTTEIPKSPHGSPINCVLRLSPTAAFLCVAVVPQFFPSFSTSCV